MPYEDMQIVSDVPSTIPDYIILLHAVWKIEIEKQYHSESFESWMSDQAKRVQLYSLLRRFPLIKRVERSLQAVMETEQSLTKWYQDNNEELPVYLLNRMTRQISELEDEMIDNFKFWAKTTDQSTKVPDISPEILQEVMHDFESADDIIPSMPTLLPETTTRWHKETNENSEEHKQNSEKAKSQKNRVKRLAPLLALTASISAAAAGGAAGYAINQALHSESSHGLTANEIAIMRRHAQELMAIRIDSDQHAQIINNLSERLQFFETQIIGNFEGTLAMTIGIDLKAIIQQLQVVTQVTLLKYNSALLAAASGKTSPYVLSQEEIDSIANRLHKEKRIQLTTDLTLIKTVPAIEDRKIIFYYNIPVIDVDKDFTIYTVTPLPIFLENGTYMPNLDSTHIAIHARGDKFTTLTDLQLAGCLDMPPRCNSHTAITPLRSGTSCVALSYANDASMCPLTMTPMALLPRFYFFDKDMFYSTPNETKVFMICKPPANQAAQPDTTLSLTGYGQVETLPGCTLTLPDGTTHHTPNRPVNATLYEKALFKEIKQYTMPPREKIIIDNSPVFSYIAKATQTIVDSEPVGTFTDRMIKSFDAASVTANTGTTVAIVLSITAITCLCYFCYYKRLCNHCCRGRTRSSTLDTKIPDFNQESGNMHWFKEQDQPEPDTISSLAAKGRLHNVSFKSPLRDLNASFPKWVTGHSTPSDPQLRTTTQMSRDLAGRDTYNEDMARIHISGLQGLRSQSLPQSPIYKPTENDIEQQQILLAQHQREAAKRRQQSEPPVSYDPHADAINVMHHSGSTMF
jgi:hypothetical protein